MATLNPHESMEGAWIEAFRVGRWTDSSGHVSDWTSERIDAFIAKYNPANHQAPLRIDHLEPQQQTRRGPAFGWIDAAKREGDRVLVRISQVQPQFQQWVKSGMLKARSIAWDPERGIHHLAFLGYNCPAVPGMENVYDDGDGLVTIQFEEASMKEKTEGKEKNGLQRLIAAVKEFIMSTGNNKSRSEFCGDCTNQVCTACCPTGAITVTPEKGAVIDPLKCTICYACSRACCMMRDPVEGMEVSNYKDHEGKETPDMKAEEVEAIVTKAVTSATKQFTDALAQVNTVNEGLLKEIGTLKTQIAGQSDARDRERFEQFCASPELRTRLTPAAATAAVAHMLTLRSASPQKFDDGKGNVTEKSQIQLYQESLKALPETVQLGEFAGSGRAGNKHGVKDASGEFSSCPVDEDRLELHNRVLAYQQQHAGTSYDTALAAVMNTKGGN